MEQTNAFVFQWKRPRPLQQTPQLSPCNRCKTGFKSALRSKGQTVKNTTLFLQLMKPLVQGKGKGPLTEPVKFFKRCASKTVRSSLNASARPAAKWSYCSSSSASITPRLGFKREHPEIVQRLLSGRTNQLQLRIICAPQNCQSSIG